MTHYIILFQYLVGARGSGIVGNKTSNSDKELLETMVVATITLSIISIAAELLLLKYNLLLIQFQYDWFYSLKVIKLLKLIFYLKHLRQCVTNSFYLMFFKENV